MNGLCNIRSRFNKLNAYFFSNNRNNLLQSLGLVRIKIVDIENGKECIANHGRDFHLLADHMTKLRNFTKEKNFFQHLDFHFS